MSSTKLLNSAFEPKEAEPRLYEYWLKEKIFTPEQGSKKPSYVIIMPPPNVTGVLHMGHALMLTLEDVLVRWKRMSGFNVLWLPGTDHAGIATQMVVERNLLKEANVTKHDLGRERFLEKVWDWKEKSQNTILSQIKVMGSSCDWSRLKFTLDPEVNEAVNECFVKLYRKGLIYRELAMTQWCPRCKTALSDLEVKPKETKTKLYTLRYCGQEDPSQVLLVSTTRPETIFADVAVAVHPKDERFAKWIGKKVIIPLTQRAIPVIQDEAVDPTFGTGALKITPAHDALDYEIGKRHSLAFHTVFNESAELTEIAGAFKGLSREKGLEKIIAELQAQNLLERELDHQSAIGHCDRCQTRVEPRVSHQWFVRTEQMAQSAVAAVETGQIKIIPETWEKTYFEWLRNIRPWCISRQLWWGHRIPAYYCKKCSQVEVAKTSPSQCSHCGHTEFRQEDDVLDTWFSSGLWPISTLGWPKANEDLNQFYPTDVLETGFDIIFFWVARMVMLCEKMTGKVPFKTVYLHPMVRDEYGQKMSKTKGNVKDPLDIIHTMGADALRFTLTAMAVHGRDVLLSDSRIEGYRNFVNKIWNAARLVQMHFGDIKARQSDTTNPLNQWIWHKFNRTAQQVNANLEQYRFFEASDLLYHFVWNDFCDWYLELLKVPEELEAQKTKRDSTSYEILEGILKLLHPFMPFVTEELYQSLPFNDKEKSIAVASYPRDCNDVAFEATANKVNQVIRLIEAVRSKRGESGISPSKEISLFVHASLPIQNELKPWESKIKRIGRIDRLDFSSEPFTAKTNIFIPLDFAGLYIPRGQLIEVEKEKVKVQKEIGQLTAELDRATQKLNNQTFMQSAPAHVIEGVKSRQKELEVKVKALMSYFSELSEP